MSIKKYFEVAENIQSLAAKTSKDISGEVESEGYHEQDIIKEERYIPYTDFKKPENFARWGSAEEYYESAIKRIYGTYPYDGSLKERIQWENESTYLDLYLLKERYPRTNGYIILSAESDAVSQVNDGYGRPSTPEYIFLRGGPNPTTGPSTTLAGQFTGSNYYEPSMNRASNLQYDLTSRGTSVEFWLKKDGFSDPSVTSREVIFDMWNGQASSSADYGRLRVELSASGDSIKGGSPILLTVLSGTQGFQRQSIAASTFTTASIADGNWHHYAITMKTVSTPSAGVETRFYVDGTLNNTVVLGSKAINDISTPGLSAHVGALVAPISGGATPSSTAAGDGKLSGSLDEFRYWKTQRTSKDIGRYWFTQVGGGVNTDPKPYITTQELANTNLGVYFKFNEGITGIASIDSTVLDYSGRYSNGTWTGYNANSRNTGSAIVSSSAATHEFLDPIIYDSHPKVKALKTELQLSGSSHDVNNNAAIYNSIPAWIAEEDTEGTKNVKYLTQILGSYFDSLHLQIDNLNTLGSKRYVSGSFEKPIPFAEKLVSSTGMVAPNLFLDADLLEKLADRSEDRVYAMSLHDIKNTIYQNIYNNISYIYKSKGTEKAFRNLIRCFGIDDELIKSNMYASNVEYELRNNRRNTVVADKFVNFNTEDNQIATVFNYADSSNTNSVGFITSSTNLTGGFATTLETEIMFPLKPSEDQAQGYFNTNVISSSLFGMHGAMPQNANNTSWRTNLEAVNFQVYAVRDELLSDNVKFVLTSSGDGHIPVISSPLYQDVYNNKRWNVAVRIRPDQYPIKGVADGANSNYVVELHGVQSEAGEIMEQFTVSGSISSVGLPAAFMTGSRRAYVGAHRTNMTGNVLQTSDVKINACRYWLDYVDDEALAGHILDTENHGAMQPHLYAFPFQTSASFGDVKKIDTLLFNWEFLNNTGSNASGYLTVADISSGSTPKTGFDTGFSVDNLLNQQHTAQGRFFKASSTTAIDKDFVVAAKLNLPENVQSEDMVKVLNAQEQDVFTSDSRPTNYFFAFEKSMYQVISEEMINYFANLKDFNNLIGDQVERYRPDYKQMAFMRQKFFEQVGNDSLDFDKFYEFYKWFDSSLSLMLGQLVPASADFSDNVRTVIENHVLERPKYQQKFPFLQRKGGNDITSSFDGDMAADSSMLCSPEDFAQGTAFFANTAMTKRQIGSSNTSQNRPWKHFHAPIREESTGPETSLLFDGTNDFVQCGDLSDWSSVITDTDFSVSFWINAASLANADIHWQLGGNTGTQRRAHSYFYQNATLGGWGIYAEMIDGGGTSYVNSDMSTPGQLVVDTWHHIAISYGTSYPAVYVNGVNRTPSSTSYKSAAGSSWSGPENQGLRLGKATGYGGGLYDGYMCDFAIFDKLLTSGEVTTLYNSGKRVKIDETGISNLVSWYKLGGGTGDTYNGTMKNEIDSGPSGVPTNFSSTAIQAVSPIAEKPYSAIEQLGLDRIWRNKNMYWHRYLEERSSTTRQDLLNSIKNTFARRVNTPVKLAVEGYTAIGGVGRHHNFVANYVFEAAAAWGRTVGTNAPVNILLAHSGGIEKLLGTTDEYYPTFKQRLGFKLNPGANSGKDNAFDGNMYAPFSLYSSSVTTGYNAEVVTNWTGNVEITNLHHDFVAGTDIPMQGPFTEKYVGGRQYRHTALNRGPTLDTAQTRGEGFRIQFSDVTNSAGSTHKNSLAIIPPNSLGGGTDTSLPTAFRMRTAAAKRPVNIRNIKMTTGSTVIGNYEKNYQVINTGGRMLNDPFFQDQSFDFALNPENDAPRKLVLNRKPVENMRIRNMHAALFADSDDSDPVYYTFPVNGKLNAASRETFLMWVKIPSIGTTQRLFNSNATRITVVGGKLRVYSYTSGTNGEWETTLNVPENEWFHLAYSYDYTSLSHVPNIYINGVKQNITTTTTPNAAKNTYSGNGVLGMSSNLGLNGYMSEVAILINALPEVVIKRLYNNASVDLNQEAQQFSPNSEYVLYWWWMGDAPGDTAAAIVNHGYYGVTAPLTKGGSGGAISGLSINDCQRWNDDFALPNRTGTNSNQTIIVNHFSSPGGYKTLSRGFLDPAHEELSVYNAYPYRNRDVIDYGLSGSASVDPTLHNRMRVQDQLNKPRGLNQRATLRSGQYGTDAAYGAINLRNTRVDGGLGYSETPSWHKTNRNRLRRMDNLAPDATPGDYPAANNYTASVFDNLFVQHAIPRSEQQYAWITGSMIAGKAIFGLDKPSCFSASTLSQLLTASRGGAAWGIATAGGSVWTFGAEEDHNPTVGSNAYVPVDFAGLNTIIVEPVSASSHIQGQPRMRSTPKAVAAGWNNYLNQSNTVAGQPYAANHQGFLTNTPMTSLPTLGYPGSAGVFNALILNRNGPYGWPTWKQIRAGESKMARNLRKNSLIGTVVPPSKIPDTVGGIQVGYIQPTQPNSFVDFYESPIESSNNPIYFYFEDNTEESDPDNNIILTVPYGNRLEYFSNPGLNNYLGLQIDMNKETAYDSVVDFAVSSSLSLKVEYSQRIYPSMVNAYNNIIRSRTTFTIANIWSPNRLRRSGDGAVDIGFGGFAYGASPFRFSGSQGQLIASSSIWPLDGPRPERLFLIDGTSNPNRAYLTSSVTASDGAGELMNFYSRYANRNTGSAGNLPRPFINMLTQSFAAPTYASRVPAGCAGNDTIVGNMVLAGGTPWIAPSQANKDPYENYTDYSDQLRAAAKDYSIVPEYRVSPLMDLYVNRSAGDFLSTAAEFDLTGATYVNSSVDKFYRTYSNADFLKYFKHVDEDLNDQRSGDLKIRKDKISLNCEAFVKFLPYKGFYPAERTLELATILSKSFGSQLAYNPDLRLLSPSLSARIYANQRAAYRIFLEPLMAPGILFNTIKSGIACSNFVLTEGSARRAWTSSEARLLPTASQTSPETQYPETQGSNGLYYGLNPSVTNYVAGPVRPPWAGASGSAARILSLGSSSSGSNYENDSNNFMLRKMPFEAIYRPTQYFNANFIGGDSREIVSIYDTAASGTSAWIPTWNYYTISGYTYGYAWQSSILMGMPSIYRTAGIIDASPELGGGEDYTLAIDNFLCESMNMFVDGGASLVSARQENFQDQVEGRIYTGVVKLFKTLSGSQGTTEPFEMYSRGSAFGIPLDANTRKTAKYGAGDHRTGTKGISFSHVTPPYFAGESYVTLTYTASYSGRPDLDDIFAQMTSSYYRDEYVPNLNAASAVERGTNEDIRMQIKDSVNLFTKIQEVPEGTNDQKSRWLIQPKFETPILNFAGVSTGSAMVPSHTRTAATASANQITTRGMWHQYGSVISSSNAGVFLSCQDKLYDQPTTDGINFSLRRHSLWDLVGMPTGKNERIGNPKNEFLLEEAVVAVPFRTNDSGEREFIKFPTSARARETVDYKKTNTYRRLNLLLDKYVFPPILDFKRFDTVDPIMMYAFEFSAKLNQKDITDIWQNLPPSVADRFEVQNAVVEERELIDAIVSRTKDIEWMVFKVKKRAKKDFEKFRRSLVSEADISAFPDQITSKMTYNWPYDYCSLVELAKIEETVTYTSVDVRSPQMNPEIEAVEAPVPATTRTATTRTTRAPTSRPPRRRRNRRPPTRRSRTRTRRTLPTRRRTRAPVRPRRQARSRTATSRLRRVTRTRPTRIRRRTRGGYR